ncbi:MAG TPA: hypothetical protein DEA08_14290 [Planctomycetes bacterium]|nr:hypothetical protein [Planctomycetota bacterium]
MYETVLTYLFGAWLAAMMCYASRFMPTRNERRYWTLVATLVMFAFPFFPLFEGDSAGVRYELAALGAFFALLIASRWVAALLAVVFFLHGSWDLLHLTTAVAVEKPDWLARFCVPFDWIVAVYVFTRQEAWRKGRPGMHPELQAVFDAEMSQAREHFHAGQLDEAFAKLERAHVLGQRYVGAHTLSHVWMLRVGIKRRDLREILGQLVRIPSGALASGFGLAPTGNTGGTNVPALTRMPIADDLKPVLDLDAQGPG